MSLAIILIVQRSMSPESFAAWGWRIPFILSILLVGVSLYIRLRMRESPIFEHVKSVGMTSARPIREAFTKWENLKIVLVSLFGATAGQGVVWYTGQFYALFYMQTILRVHPVSASVIVAIALLLGMPFYVVFAALSDRIGRKRIMMAGFLISALAFIPIYRAMVSAAGNEVVTVTSQRNEVTGAISLTPQALVNGQLETAPQAFPYESMGALLAEPGARTLIMLVFVQIIFATMAYGPIAAYLVEAFPARIRYTALSLPYHIGNGVFGGLLPVIGLSVVAATGSIYAGLYYPIAVSLIAFVVGMIFLRETRHVRIWHEVGGRLGDRG
jgi:MFS family permease